ncbi:hypothetical protein M0813_06461 [Anaeramoeba flamelloides]|uniref:Uncharacterized protein n=1 Tax=Anaeramoeba flamelloides TaxID=1746091 RepID=A0ABQ8XE12_9EUKA|nr:hypothetical protein M0813_06461 [Anaeramoeba flamelloides]
MLSAIFPVLTQKKPNLFFQIPKLFFNNLNGNKQIDLPKQKIYSNFTVDQLGIKKDLKTKFIVEDLCLNQIKLGNESLINGFPKKALKEFKSALDFATSDQEKMKCYSRIISFYGEHLKENKYSQKAVDLSFQAREIAFQNKDLDLLVSSSVLIYDLLSRNEKNKKAKAKKIDLEFGMDEESETPKPFLKTPLDTGIYSFETTVNKIKKVKQFQDSSQNSSCQQEQENENENENEKEQEKESDLQLTELLKGIELQNSLFKKQKRSLFDYVDLYDFPKTVQQMGTLIKLSEAYISNENYQMAFSVLLNSYVIICVLDGSLKNFFLNENSSDLDGNLDFDSADLEIDFDLSDFDFDLDELDFDLGEYDLDLDLDLDLDFGLSMSFNERDSLANGCNGKKKKMRNETLTSNGKKKKRSNGKGSDDEQTINYKLLNYFTNIKSNKKLNKHIKNYLKKMQFEKIQKNISDTIALENYTSEILFSLSEIFLFYNEYSGVFFTVKELLNRFEYQKALNFIEDIVERLIESKNDVNLMLPFLTNHWPLLILELKSQVPLEFIEKLTNIELLMSKLI